MFFSFSLSSLLLFSHWDFILSFYISNEANYVLNKLRKRKLLNYREEPMSEIYESEYKAHQTALNEILVIAKKDLKIK